MPGIAHGHLLAQRFWHHYETAAQPSASPPGKGKATKLSKPPQENLAVFAGAPVISRFKFIRSLQKAAKLFAVYLVFLYPPDELIFQEDSPTPHPMGR